MATDQHEPNSKVKITSNFSSGDAIVTEKVHCSGDGAFKVLEKVQPASQTSKTTISTSRLDRVQTVQSSNSGPSSTHTTANDVISHFKPGYDATQL